MTEQIKVSIVVAVYNAMPYLHQCLDSICNQTFQNLQIILVDDGSTDGSLELIREYELKDQRIQVLENKEDGLGAAKARNLGLSYVTGKYVLILDADDIFHLSLVEKTCSTAENCDAQIVLFDAVWFDNKTNKPLKDTFTLNYNALPVNQVFRSQDIAENFFMATSGPAWCQLYKVSHLKRNNSYFQELNGHDDVFFSFSNLATASRIVALSEVLLRYRCNNSQSLIVKRHRIPLTSVKLAKHLKDWLEERELFTRFHYSFIIKFKYMINMALHSVDDLESLKILYTYLQDIGLKELGFLGYQGEKELPLHCKVWIETIANKELSEYLYEQRKSLNQLNLYGDGKAFEIVTNGSLHYQERVILYGGGRVGLALFTENIFKKHCTIVAWVDKNHENIGFPVTGLETIQQVAFDSVLIAIESESVAEAVKKELVSLGVPLEKIKWKAVTMESKD